MITNILTILKTKRTEAHIHQKTIADALGITQSNYSRLEAGKSKLTFSAFLIICEIIGIEPTKLLQEMEIQKND